MEINAHTSIKNTSYNFIGYVWPMVFSILATPIIVLNLGVKDYGVYIFINSVVGIIGLLDLGISTAVTKYLLEYQAQKNEEGSKRLVHTANSLFLLIGILGLLISLFIGIAGGALFPNKITDASYFFILFSLAGVNFLFGSISNIYNIIPTVMHRFDILVKTNLVLNTTNIIVNIVIVLLGYKLKMFLLCQVLMTIAFMLIKRRVALKILPIVKYKFALIKEEIVRCYKFGLATAINNTASVSLALLDRLIIPIFVGPSQLTYYSLPGNIPARIPAITDNLSGIIFPVSTSLKSAGNEEKLKRFYIRSVRLMFLISSAITLSIIFLSDKILRYWLNADFADKSTHILIILAVTNFIISLLSPITSFFMGIGKLKRLSLVSFSMAAINAILLLILLPRYGITGAAWAFLISILPIFYALYLIENKYLHLEKRLSYYIGAVLKMIATGLALLVIVRLVIYPAITNFPTLFILGPITVCIYFALYFAFGFFEEEDLVDFKKFLVLIVNKFPLRKMK